MAAEKMTEEERFWSKVEKTDFCWLWTASRRPLGYGTLVFRGKTASAHRVAYELVKGPIPPGLVLDHLCRNPPCVNPDHLEAVTNRVNILRGEGTGAKNRRKTHCKHGHPLSGGNLLRWASKAPERKCATCMRHWKEVSNARARQRRAEIRAAKEALRMKPGTALIIAKATGNVSWRATPPSPERFPVLEVGTEVALWSEWESNLGNWLRVLAPNGEIYNVSPDSVRQKDRAARGTK